MARNIVVCCDGTSNEFGSNPTNTIRLVQVAEKLTDVQLVHYAPGVGTLPEPSVFTRTGQWFSIHLGLAFGKGLTDIVEESYSFLMDFWEPDDRVYLFGFSRGAYSARVLAAMLYALGLLPKGSRNLVPYAMRLFNSARSSPGAEVNEDGAPDLPNYWMLLNQFRKSFARSIPLPGKPNNRRFPVHFLGVWDTVSSVGSVWNPTTFPFTRSNPGVSIVRHAISIDERRWLFRQNEFGEVAQQDCQSRLFAGSHGDVGGGYRDSQLWRCSFEWMLREAKASGLLLNEVALNHLEISSPKEPWREKTHDSLTCWWMPAEIIPKWSWDENTGTKSLRMGLGRARDLASTSLVDQSVLLRIRDLGYHPSNLPKALVEFARTLTDIRDAVPLSDFI